MEEISNEEIEKVLYRLIGETEPYGDETIDKERYENLLKWNSVLNIAFDEIKECLEFRNDNRCSMNKIGTMASEILKGVRKDIDMNLKEEEPEIQEQGLKKEAVSIEIPPTCHWCGEKHIPVEIRSNARGMVYYGICPKCHKETVFIEVGNA